MRSFSWRYTFVLFLVPCSALVTAASGTTLGPSVDWSRGDVRTSCRWESVLTFDLFTLADIAVDRSGRVIATGSVRLPDDPHRLVTLLSDDAGASWRVVDVFPNDGSFDALGYRVDVDRDGSVFVLASMHDDEGYAVFLRRSDPTGEQWQSSEQRWNGARLGALRSGPRGRVYVALGFAGPERGAGWTVESAPGAVGTFRVDDVFVPDVDGVFTVAPHDVELAGDGSLWVSGHINGAPDRWVTRMRPPERGPRSRSEWRTVDLFELSPTSYGLAAAAIVPFRAGRALVVGFGVEGGERNDYAWLQRLVRRRGEPFTFEPFQLEPGRHSMALDAILYPPHDLLVAGTAASARGSMLLLRRSRDFGASWETVLSLPGNTSPWNVRIAAGPAGEAYVAATLDSSAVILRCQPFTGASHR